jgi:hypothetical protein
MVMSKDTKHPSYRCPRGEISHHGHGVPRVVAGPSSASQSVSIVVKLHAQVDEVVHAAPCPGILLVAVAGVERDLRRRCYKLTRRNSLRVGVA